MLLLILRAKETAEIILKELEGTYPPGLELALDRELREIAGGEGGREGELGHAICVGWCKGLLC